MEEQCETTMVHPETVRKVEKLMESREKLYDLALLYKTFGDETRLRIMDALSHEVMCVCDLSQLLQMTQSATSHQLRYLRQMNLVKSNKVGKVVYYRLSDEHISKILNVGLQHIEEGGVYE